MKRTVFPSPSVPYSLHDMELAFEISGNSLLLRLPCGMVRTGSPCTQTEGRVEFHGVDWGFCYAYRFDCIGNVGPFTGEKLYLMDFIKNSRNLHFSVCDEVYGYRQAKFSGYISSGDSLRECIIEIYYEGDMIFIEE